MSDLRSLRADPLNPRRISPAEREALAKSLAEFGDLGGIVRNVETNEIVGGHQRVDVFKHRRTKIVKEPKRDSTGTVAEGYVLIEMARGQQPLRLAYREVRWNRAKQWAANIAANAAGGQFDSVMLGKLMVKLEQERFPIESIPIDPVELRRAFRDEEAHRIEEAGIAEPIDGLDVGRPRQVKTVTCPACQFQWDPAEKPPVGDDATPQPRTQEGRKRAQRAAARRAQEEPQPVRDVRREANREGARRAMGAPQARGQQAPRARRA